MSASLDVSALLHAAVLGYVHLPNTASSFRFHFRRIQRERERERTFDTVRYIRTHTRAREYVPRRALACLLACLRSLALCVPRVHKARLSMQLAGASDASSRERERDGEEGATLDLLVGDLYLACGCRAACASIRPSLYRRSNRASNAATFLLFSRVGIGEGFAPSERVLIFRRRSWLVSRKRCAPLGNIVCVSMSAMFVSGGAQIACVNFMLCEEQIIAAAR